MFLTYTALNPYKEGLKRIEDTNTNTVAIIEEAFRGILKSYGATNTALVIKELDKAGYLHRRKPNSIKNRLRFNGVLQSCYEIVLPEDDSESDDGCMTLEYILTHFEGVDES